MIRTSPEYGSSTTSVSDDTRCESIEDNIRTSWYNNTATRARSYTSSYKVVSARPYTVPAIQAGENVQRGRYSVIGERDITIAYDPVNQHGKFSLFFVHLDWRRSIYIAWKGMYTFAPISGQLHSLRGRVVLDSRIVIAISSPYLFFIEKTMQIIFGVCNGL
jgi:hypothetical protein